MKNLNTMAHHQLTLSTTHHLPIDLHHSLTNPQLLPINPQLLPINPQLLPINPQRLPINPHTARQSLNISQPNLRMNQV